MNLYEPAFGMANIHLDSRPVDNQRPLHPAFGTDMPEPSVTDTELLIRRTFTESPIKGYELLFRRYYKPLCSHAARFVYDRQLAEDMVVDVFAQFWQQRLDEAVTTSFRSYLFTMVRNRALTHLRREFGRGTTDNLSDADSADITTPLHLVEYNELQLKINETIQSASPHSQKVFVMSRFEGKKNGDIAAELGLSVKTVEGHITKMLALLRHVLRHNKLLTIGVLLGFLLKAQGVNVVSELIAAVTRQNV